MEKPMDNKNTVKPIVIGVLGTKKMLFVDFTFPVAHKMKIKECGKLKKYLKFSKELKRNIRT